jgi:hypothetical protein
VVLSSVGPVTSSRCTSDSNCSSSSRHRTLSVC